MINNNELMFGNIINRQYVNPNPKGQTLELEPCIIFDVKETSVLITLGLSDNSKMRLNNGLFFGVLLDEFWLLKFGAIKDRNDNFLLMLNEKTVLSLSNITTDLHFQTELANNYNEEWRLIDLQTVHQLQNLYYCLTGVKLECVVLS